MSKLATVCLLVNEYGCGYEAVFCTSMPFVRSYSVESGTHTRARRSLFPSSHVGMQRLPMLVRANVQFTTIVKGAEIA